MKKRPALYLKPAPLPNSILRRTARHTGKSMTRLLEESIVKLYGGKKEQAMYFKLLSA